MSTDTMDKTTPAEQTVEALTAKAGEWDRERAASLAELAQVEAGAGAQMLDDPDAAESLAARAGALRARADLAGRAATEARQRAQATHVAELRNQADALQPEVTKARRALAEHDAKRDKLRKALEDFTGVPWLADPPSVAGGGSRAARPRELLQWALEDVQQQQATLQGQADAVAADPDWQPPAIVAAQELREEWLEALSGYRESAAALEQVRVHAEKLAVAYEDPLDNMPRGQERLQDAREEVANYEDHLARFPQDVRRFRERGLDLPDDKVSALKLELGLKDA